VDLLVGYTHALTERQTYQRKTLSVQCLAWNERQTSTTWLAGNSKNLGGRDRDRTGDPLLAKLGQGIKSKSLFWLVHDGRISGSGMER